MLYTIWTSPFPFILSSSSRLASVDTIWKWRRLKRLHCGPWQGLSSDSMQIKSVLCAFSCWGNAPIQSHGAGGQPSFWFLIRDRGLSGVRAGGSGGLSLSSRYAWVAETGSKSRRQELLALARVCAQNWPDVWLIIHDVRRRVTVLPMMTLGWRWQHFSPRPCNHPCCAQSGAL